MLWMDLKMTSYRKKVRQRKTLAHHLKVATRMRYLAKTKSCTDLYCYLPNSGLIDTRMWHVPHTYSCKYSSTLMCGKYRLFFGNDEYRAKLAQLRTSTPLHTTCHLPNIYQILHTCSRLHKNETDSESENDEDDEDKFL